MERQYVYQPKYLVDLVETTEPLKKRKFTDPRPVIYQGKRIDYKFDKPKTSTGWYKKKGPKKSKKPFQKKKIFGPSQKDLDKMGFSKRYLKK